MPKEKFTDVVKTCDVVVGWGNDHVQLASIKTGTEGSGNPNNGWYATLSREQINRLIKSLRRARDYVYGKDE